MELEKGFEVAVAASHAVRSKKSQPMMTMKTRCLFLLPLCVSFTAAQDLGYINFGPAAFPTDTNLGSSLVLAGGELTITSRSIIDLTQPFVLTASGQAGTIFVDSDANAYKGGLGVQNGSAEGSHGVSGAGPNQNEELIFTYTTGVTLGTVEIILNILEFGHGVGDKDDPYLWVDTSLGLFAINEAQLGVAATFAGGAGDAAQSATIDFSLLGIDPDATLNSFVLRETRDHIIVKAMEAGILIPEPGSMLLIGISGLGLLARRRRSNPPQVVPSARS